MFKAPCAICDNDSFENIDGFYYCTECNTKSQNVCDIELCDEEDDHVGKKIIKPLSTVKNVKKMFEDQESHENCFERNFSTLEVFNHLLKTQCDELVQLGAPKIIHEVVLTLWMKYLKKLGLAFADNQHLVNTKNVKWHRDQKYFENYRLNLEFEQAKHKKVHDDISQEVKNNENNIERENTDNEYNELDDCNIVKSQEKEETQQKRNEKKKPKQKKFNNFKLVQMPHTIAILNLGLILIKSQILLTDLIRLIWNGEISYFNINQVLPEYMEFSYAGDQTVFNINSIPNTDYMRYLTAKLGQYLGLGKIDLIPISQVSARFIMDLNLPKELNEVVCHLMKKTNMHENVMQVDLFKAEYKNLEAVALSYIYVVIIVLFLFNGASDLTTTYKIKQTSHVNDQGGCYQTRFLFNEWLYQMQNDLDSVRRETLADLNEVSYSGDLERLKIFKHRHKINSKPYISQYRRKEIKDPLKAPLFGHEDNREGDMQNKEREKENLLSILKINKSERKNRFNEQSVQVYMTEEKAGLLCIANYKSTRFNSFVRDEIKSKESKGKYLLGLNASTCDWLLDMFHYVAQTRSHLKMMKYVNNILDKLN